MADSLRRCSIAIQTVSRSLWFGFRSSDSYGYHSPSKPAPHWLRIPPDLAMLVQYAGWEAVTLRY
ncbi:MAG: hypothetical protein QF609_06265 [Gammaproteobacteria bacterium]|nr:hypothetical protein [Gammaproteobacteria bacterium]